MRLIIYRRTKDHVKAYACLVGPDSSDYWPAFGQHMTAHPYHQIRGSEVDPEFAAAWYEHVDGQDVVESRTPSVTRADLIARGLVRPCRPVHHFTMECP